MRLNGWLSAGVGAILILALVYSIWPRAQLAELAKVERKTLVETRDTVGKVRIQKRELLTAFADGELSKIDLKSGDRVKKGQRIAILRWKKDRKVTAPFDGVVATVHRPSGGPIRRGDAIIEIVEPDRVEVVMELLATDAVRATPGMIVMVRGWGGADALTAKITKVSRAGFVTASELGAEEERAEVVAVIDPPQPDLISRLGDNYHVTCRLTLGEHPDSLVIPIGAIFRTNDDWSVFKVSGGRARQTVVKLGERNLDEVKVLDGLNEGDEVVAYPGTLVRDGMRIKSNR